MEEASRSWIRWVVYSAEPPIPTFFYNSHTNLHTVPTHSSVFFIQYFISAPIYIATRSFGQRILVSTLCTTAVAANNNAVTPATAATLIKFALCVNVYLTYTNCAC